MRALKLHRAPRRHEEVFGAHYTRLVEYARSLCPNVTAAEDLVHEAYVLFVTARPDLELIDRPDAYLAVIVKNVYLSEIRRAARFAHEPIEILEYDTAELGLRHAHPLTDIETRETLVRLCRYALLRRTSSKAGSVLVLRYFLGYYPAEIALLARSATRAVDDLLVEARREARQYLEHPEREATLVNAGEIGDGADFLEGLRTSIFQHHHDGCFSRRALRQLYAPTAPHPIDAKALSEITTCASCLDEASDQLDLPRLADRYPTDSLGPSSRSPKRAERVHAPARTRRLIAAAMALAIALLLAGDRIGATVSAVADWVRAVAGSWSSTIHMPAVPPLPSGPLRDWWTPLRAPALSRPTAAFGNEVPAAVPSASYLFELHAEALWQLHRVGALVSEEILVERGEGRLAIRARVESAARQAQIRAALAPIVRAVGTDVRIEVFGRAVAQPFRLIERPPVRELEATTDRTVASDDLRRHFGREFGSEADPRVQGAARELSIRVLDEARQVLLNAFAVQRLATLLAQSDIPDPPEPALVTLRTLVREYAGRVESHAAALLRDIAPVLGGDTRSKPDTSLRTATGSSVSDIATDSARIVTLASELDDAVRAMFAVTAGTRPETVLPGSALVDLATTVQRLAAALHEW